MLETMGLGAGSYPDPPDDYEQTFNEDYDDWYADYYHDLEMLGEIE